MSRSGPCSLDQTFTHTTQTHASTIHWTRIGSPSLPPLIFIHGTPWSSFVWHNLASTLLSRYCIYLYDHPGFGLSPAPQRTSSSPSTIDHEAEDLDPSLTLRAQASAALIKSWDLSTAPHIVAHDNGGLVSLRVLLQHDIKFASLCLIDVVVLPNAEKLPFFNLVAKNTDVFTSIPPHLLEGLIRGYVRSATFHPLPSEIEDALSAPWCEGGKQGNAAFVREMVQASKRDTLGLESEYSSVAGLVPTKIIWGRDDKWLPNEIAGRLGEALGVGGEDVIVVEEAGHLIHYDQPSRLALEVGLWLDRHDKS